MEEGDCDSDLAILDSDRKRRTGRPTLYAFQKEGVAWLNGLVASQCPGGCLADEMGLGKTVQVSAFLAEHLTAGKCALIIAPTTIIAVWQDALRLWAPHLRVITFLSGDRKQAAGEMHEVLCSGRGGVLLASYGLAALHADVLGAKKRAVAAKELPRRRPAAPPVARPASSAAAPAPRAAPKKPLATDAAGVVLLLDDSADDDDDDGVEDGEGCDDSSVEGVDMVAAVLGSAAPAPATAGGAAAAASSGGTSSGAPGRKRPRSWAWERSPIPVPLPSSAAESAAAGRPPAAWDVVVLDEAHKIKNPSTLSHEALQALPARARVILSGTPLQNNLNELWSIVDFFSWGALLGPLPVFRRTIAAVIERGRERHASAGERQMGEAATQRLGAVLAPHLLQRRTVDVVDVLPPEAARGDELDEARCGEESGAAAAARPHRPRMAAKSEVVLWCHMVDAQVRTYKETCGTDGVREIIRAGRIDRVLGILLRLRQLSNSPALLTADPPPVAAAAEKRGPGTARKASLGGGADGDEPSVRALLAGSGKLRLFVRLVRVLRAEGARILVFSQWARMLDLLGAVLRAMDEDGDSIPPEFDLSPSPTPEEDIAAEEEPASRAGLCARPTVAFLRIDGTVTPAQRAAAVASFNAPASAYSLFLLTTGVGSLGLTLTSATRVIIFDPCWNPQVDAQAVNRAWRVGQEREVVSYRLLSCGSLEERMYCRALFKAGLSQSVLAGGGSGAGDQGEGGGGAAAQDPTWSAADVDAGDESSTQRQAKGGGAKSVARLLSKEDVEALLRLGSVDSCDTQRLFDAVIPREERDAARLGGGAVARHLSRLEALLGPECIGMARHDALLGLTEEKLATLRSTAGLPCAALAKPTDVLPDPALVAKWWALAAAALLLSCAAPSAASATYASLEVPAAATQSAAAAATPIESAAERHARVVAESIRIMTRRWTVGELGRLVPDAASHVATAAASADASSASALLASIVATLGPKRALELIILAERNAIRQWSLHGRRGECGHGPCRSITAAVDLQPSLDARLAAYLTQHPECSPPQGGHAPPASHLPAAARAAFVPGAVGAAQIPGPAIRPSSSDASALGKRPREPGAPLPAAAASPPSLDAADAKALAAVITDAASVSLLLSCVGENLQGESSAAAAGPQPPRLSAQLRESLASAHDHLRQALLLLRGPTFAQVSDDPTDRLRAVSTRLVYADARGSGSHPPSAAALQVAQPAALLTWALSYASKRIVRHAFPRSSPGGAAAAGIGGNATSSSSAAAAAAAGPAWPPGARAGGVAPTAAAASEAAPVNPAYRSIKAIASGVAAAANPPESAAGSASAVSADSSGASSQRPPRHVAEALISQIAVLLETRLQRINFNPAQLAPELLPHFDARRVAEVQDLLTRPDLDTKNRETLVAEFVMRCIKSAPQGNDGCSDGDTEDEEEEVSESEYEELPPDTFDHGSERVQAPSGAAAGYAEDDGADLFGPAPHAVAACATSLASGGVATAAGGRCGIPTAVVDLVTDDEEGE